MIEIEQVEAVQFHRVMTAGRTTPLLLSCERADGRLIDAVVKFASGRECTPTSLAAELIASQLAADLKLPTPTPFRIVWDQLFTDSLAEATALSVIRPSHPPAFGSSFVTNGFSTWPRERRLVGEPMQQQALAVFFFDCMIGNADRGIVKPNILVRHDELRVIDHEMAFRDYLLIAKPAAPWSVGGLNPMSTHGAHIFAAPLAKLARQLDFGPIKAAWQGLSDQQINGYLAALPPEWLGDRLLASFAIQRIRDCRDRIDACVDECRRVLNG